VISNRDIEVGQHYRTTSAAGGPAPVVWQVVGIYLPWRGGFEHARMKSKNDRAETMTLASSVVTDKARFVRIE
jgi:hypothetical protein